MSKNDKKAKDEEDGAAGTAVVKPEEKGRALQQHALADMYAEDAGAGLENITLQDTRIPTLKILQGLSPEVQEGDPKYIEGARPGMFLHNVTRDVFDGKEGVMVIPVHFHKQWVEWRPRNAGGGFVNAYDTREDALAQVTEGNEIQETANHFLLIRDENGHWVPIVLQCKSTMLGFSRSFNAMMQSLRVDVPEKGPIQPPSFAAIYNLSTARQSNDRGSWYTVVAERVSMVEEPAVYGAAKTFRTTLVQGDVGSRIRHDDDAPVGRNASASPPSDKDSVTGEKLPEM